MPAQVETAVFGGGCFWCIEAVFQQIEGVLRADSGYAGGHVERPTYEQVCAGDTGHVEVVSITYDPAVIGYHELLEIFFASHDPTTPNRQGNDVGTQYRSAMFPADEAQRVLFEAARSRAGEHWGGGVVTTIEPLGDWWPAEEYHQDFFAKNPGQGYCLAVAVPKVNKVRASFQQYIKAA